VTVLAKGEEARKKKKKTKKQKQMKERSRASSSFEVISIQAVATVRK